MGQPDATIDPQDYAQAIATLNELFAFWLVLNHDQPDSGLGHSFAMDTLYVLRVAREKYGVTLPATLSTGTFTGDSNE